MSEHYGPRDWMLAKTDGAYQNRCCDCGELFIGYKRSQLCRACTPNPMPRVEERNAGVGFPTNVACEAGHAPRGLCEFGPYGWRGVVVCKHCKQAPPDESSSGNAGVEGGS